MNLLFLLIPIALFLGIGIYLAVHIAKIPIIAKYKKNKLFGAVIVVFLFVLMFLRVWSVLPIIFFLFGSYIIVEIVDSVLKRSVNEEIYKKWGRVYMNGAPAVVITVIIAVYAYINANTVITTRYNISTEKTGMEDGIKSVMISDSHLGTIVKIDDMKKYCTQISEMEPDIVFLVGDIYDESTVKEDMINACSYIGNIKSKYGIYYVNGNHDDGSYGNRNFRIADIEKEFEKNGVHILNDTSELIDNKFYVSGRIDRSFGERASIAEIIKDNDMSKYNILLDHQPTETNDAAEKGIDLELCGHTHAGQIWPMGQLCELLGINDLNYGIRNIGNYNLIVSSGIGGWGFPMRTSEHAEIVIVGINKNI
ncbi:MAG: metallophosphoesterase [Firmicutes bacterium]|nr:metallophosphoesterase [Bacillota bacterium]